MNRLLLFIILPLLFSCVPQKKILLFQDTNNSGDTLQRGLFTYKIQPRDRLIIRVSSYNDKLTEFFNLDAGVNTIQASTLNNIIFTYLVDDSGMVDIPLLNKVMVKELSVEESRQKIQFLIREEVPDAYVTVKLATFKVNVLGEVGTKGTVVETDKDFMTIYEAISNAGSLGDFANRKKIKVIRTDGELSTIGYIDLTSRDAIMSPYYYLRPNDIVYVDRLKVRVFLDNLATVSKIVGVATIVIVANQLINIWTK